MFLYRSIRDILMYQHRYLANLVFEANCGHSENNIVFGKKRHNNKFQTLKNRLRPRPLETQN